MAAKNKKGNTCRSVISARNRKSIPSRFVYRKYFHLLEKASEIKPERVIRATNLAIEGGF
jgi:hypothetical protein